MLPVLTDNCVDTAISQPTIESRVSQCFQKEIDQERTRDVPTAHLATQSTVVLSSLVLSITTPRSNIELNPELSTLNGPPGLLIGEKINVKESDVVVPLSLSNVSTDELENQHASATIRTQSNVCVSQRSVGTSFESPNEPIDEAQLSITSVPGITSIVSQNVNITSELSTLDGPSGLPIGEETRRGELLASTQLVLTLAELSARKLRVVHSLIALSPGEASGQPTTHHAFDTTSDNQHDCINTSGCQRIPVTQLANNGTNATPLDLVNKQQQIQSQPISDNPELDLDESVLLSDSIQTYTPQRPPGFFVKRDTQYHRNSGTGGNRGHRNPEQFKFDDFCRRDHHLRGHLVSTEAGRGTVAPTLPPQICPVMRWIHYRY